jgi:uncharacterized protein (DUF2062 family)
MNPRLYSFSTSGNPIVQAISLLVLGLALIGAVLMGAVILTFLFGFAVIAAIVFSIRIWWLRRGIARSRARSREPAAHGRYIEAEYTVIEEREPDKQRD